MKVLACWEISRNGIGRGSRQRESQRRQPAKVETPLGRRARRAIGATDRTGRATARTSRAAAGANAPGAGAAMRYVPP